ncbi:restriction endonuclease subunit S [Campylobacter lari]|uniref:Restriction endonuclease subunit S n=1 Tax=Campylobacter lari TaxID=201 RepID=A0A5L4NN01_CAMLA|nr:restriction endonuclease subunit S [Campylobacter lari]EAI3913751.1 restriction endonuclease subunit S [Campylobacter lari]EAI4449581.1 restriction endonuclease subunit S [Campylobacter lari]EAJ6187894.1 restriction endonuclease subunit S [Campylobacter lari]EAK0828089.1 restriction endonuclease subunit S [Campylobacter lari]
MTKLPQGWEVKKLGDIAEISSGGTPSRNKKEYWENGTIPWVKIKDIKEKFISTTEEFITEDGLKNSSAKLFKKGTLLYSIFATLGEVAILDIDATTNQAIAGINIKENNINSLYLMYFLRSIKDEICSKGRGVAQNNLNLTILKQIKIPLPPLQEQERIVGILDESFAKIDESIKILEQDLLNLDELMQSTLQKAFDPLKDNAKENYKLPQGWEWKSLGEIGEIITGTTPSKNNPNFYGNEYPLFKPSDLNGDMIIKFASDNLSKLGFDNARNLPKDTILVVCIGASIGKVGLSGVNGSCNQQINAIIPNSAFVSKYLFFVCLSNYFQEILKKNASQTTLPIINKTEFSKLQIPMPSLKEQEQIASYLDELSSNVKNLKQNYQMQIKNLQELKKSLLDKAFQGRL